MFYIYLVVEALSGFIGSLPLVFLFQLHLLRKNSWRIKPLLPHFIGVWLFCLFLAGIFTVTGVPSIYNIRFSVSLNLIPFVDFIYFPGHYILNILLFMPLGFMLPFLWPRFEKPWLPILAGFFLSLAVELGQLFCYRATDIDDLIMNTLGAALGIWTYLFVAKRFTSVMGAFKEGIILAKGGFMVCCASVVISMFVIMPIIFRIIF